MCWTSAIFKKFFKWKFMPLLLGHLKHMEKAYREAFNLSVQYNHWYISCSGWGKSITHINNLEVLFPEGGVGNLLGIYIKLGSIFAISEMIVVILFICLCFFAAALNCLDGYWIVDKVVSLNIVFVATQRSRIKLSCNPLLQFKKKNNQKKKNVCFHYPREIRIAWLN